MRRVLVSLLFASALLGCSGADGDGTDEGAAAVSHADAARTLDFTEHLDVDFPATAGAAAKLGIARWDVYTAGKGDVLGVVAFATNAKGDVRYALSVADGSAGASAAILAYDDHGVDDAAVVTPDDIALLTADIAMIRDHLQAPPPGTEIHAAALSSDAKRCALGVAVALVGAAALVGTGAWVGAAVGGALAPASTAAFDVFAVALANQGATSMRGTGMAVGAVAGWAGAFVVPTIAIDATVKTIDACKKTIASSEKP